MGAGLWSEVRKVRWAIMGGRGLDCVLLACAMRPPAPCVSGASFSSFVASVIPPTPSTSPRLKSRPQTAQSLFPEAPLGGVTFTCDPFPPLFFPHMSHPHKGKGSVAVGMREAFCLCVRTPVLTGWRRAPCQPHAT